MALPYLLLGAAAMYLLDPQSGRKRREALGGQVSTARNLIQNAPTALIEAREAVVTDAKERAHDILDGTRQALKARRLGENTPTLADAIDSVIEPWRRREWSPAQRALAGAFGAAAAAYGYLRGGIRGMAWCAVGGAVMARVTANDDIAKIAEAARKRIGANGATPVAGD